MKNEMKTFRIETEDRYGRFNEYEIQAETLELATLIANKRVNLSNGAFAVSVKEVEAKEEKPFSPREFWGDREIVRDSDGSAVVGWYDDSFGNDVRCRD
jgi:hypothetical protein